MIYIFLVSVIEVILFHGKFTSRLRFFYLQIFFLIFILLSKIKRKIIQLMFAQDVHVDV